MADRAVTVRILGDANSLERAFGRGAAAGQSFGAKFAGVARKLALVGTVAAAGLAVLGGKAAIDFESSFAGVRKTVDATEAEFGQLEKGFRSLAKQIPINVNELNRIGEAAGQLGIKKKAIIGFTRTVADLSVATNLTSEQASDDLARLANITQMPQSQFRRLGSTVVALGNSLAGTESEIVDFGLRVAGAGKQVGLAEHEILAIAGALSSVGIEAEAGGTAISTVMVKIEAAVRKGGEGLNSFARVAGMSAADFKRRWQTDAAQALVTFVEGLARTKEEGGDVFGTLDKLGLGSIRVRDALLRASGAGDLLREALKTGAKAWKENTALTREAEERYKTTASQLQLLRNRAIDLGISFGEHVIPPLNRAIGRFVAFTDKVTGAKGLKAKVEIVLQGARGLAGDVARTGAELGKKLASAIQAELKLVDWSDVGRAIVDGVSAGLTAAGNLAQKIADTVMEAAGSVDWINVGKRLGPGLAAAVATAIATLADPMFWIHNWDTMLLVASVTLPGRVIRIAVILGKAFFALGRFAARELGVGFRAAFPTIDAALTSLVSRVGSGLRGLPGAVREAARLGLRLLGLEMGNWVRTAFAIAAGIPGAVGRALARLAPNVVIALRMAGQSIRNTAATWAASGLLLGLRVVASVKQGLAKLAGVTTAGLRGGVAAVRGMVGAFFSAAFSIGASIIDGVVSGIAGLAGRVGAKIASEVRRGIDWARDHVGSTAGEYTFKTIGFPAGEGIIDGLRAALAGLNRALAGDTNRAVTAFGRRFKSAAAAIGFVETRREIEDLRRAVVDAERALEGARKGKKKAEILEAERQLARAREDITIRSLRRQVDAEERALERRRDAIEKFRDAAGRLADQILRAFDKETSKHKTASQLERERILERRELEDMNKAVADAERELIEARESGDAQRIADAEQRLARAREDFTLRSLERKADAEREAYEEERDRLREALEGRLTALGDHFAKEGGAWKTFFASIVALAQEFGVAMAAIAAPGAGGGSGGSSSTPGWGIGGPLLPDSALSTSFGGSDQAVASSAAAAVAALNRPIVVEVTSVTEIDGEVVWRKTKRHAARDMLRNTGTGIRA